MQPKPKRFYEETGMYIDWPQLKRLPQVNTFIDIGVGPKGTPVLWEQFRDAKIICIDPLDEAEIIAAKLLQNSDYIFLKTALGNQSSTSFINIDENLGKSSLLISTPINTDCDILERRTTSISRLDDVLKPFNDLGAIGIKIDTEGYELNILKGAIDTLSSTRFVLAEVRHNHISFEGQYGFGEFNAFMASNGFVPSIVFTAKPFIVDICYEPLHVFA